MALPHYEMGSWGVQQLLALMESPSRKARQVKLSGPWSGGTYGIASAGVKG